LTDCPNPGIVCIEIIHQKTVASQFNTVSEQNSSGGSLENLTSNLISVTEASRRSGLTTGHLRKLLREGQIEGVKIGRNWLTTEEAVQAYLQQEIKPGPKPKHKE
jgi:excisionase family DNA binding protein